MAPKILYKKLSSKSLAEAVLLASLASLLMGLPADAESYDHVVPLAVGVRFDLPMLTKFWKAEQWQQIEADLRDGLADHLEEVFPYWYFESSPLQSGARLEIGLFRQHGEILLQASLWSDAATLGEPLRKVLYKPHQIGEVTKLIEGPLLFVGIVREKLLTETSNRDHLRQLFMEHVPVTTAGQWRVVSRSVLAVVLPLPWEPKFKELQVSNFRIFGRRRGYPPLRLYATGSPDPSPYPVQHSAPASSYEALQVFPLLEESPQNLTDYTPNRVYIRNSCRGSLRG